MNLVPEISIDAWNLSHENKITESIYKDIEQVKDTSLPDSQRTVIWEKVLKKVVEKKSVGFPIGRYLRKAEFNEPAIVKSPIDDRVLESYAPRLLDEVNFGKANPNAAFAILEYFLRNGYHQISEEQAVQLARQFPYQAPNLTFKEYKRFTEQANAHFVVPGKSSAESWIMKREVMDLMEITENIRKKYLEGAFGKTILITELMRVSAQALRTVHLAGTRFGVKKLLVEDRKLLNSPNLIWSRDYRQELVSDILKRPELILSLLFGQSRDIGADAQKAFGVPKNIEIEGEELIPKSGGVIFAFSHLDRWLDPSIPHGWEKLKMIEAIQKNRVNRTVNLAVYLNYAVETAPKMLKLAVSNLLHKSLAVIQKSYGISILEVDSLNNEKNRQFISQSLAVLRRGEPFVIAPEAYSTTEVLKPKRGLGLLARVSGTPVVGIAFREEKTPDGQFKHKVIFTQPTYYNKDLVPGQNNQQKDQAFADHIMATIASKLPMHQRGIFESVTPPEMPTPIPIESIKASSSGGFGRRFVKVAGAGLAIAGLRVFKKI